MAINDIMQAAIKSRDTAGAQFVNTLGFRQVAETAGDPLSELASDIVSHTLASYKAMIHSSISIYEVAVQDVVPGTAALHQLAVNPPQSGSGSGEALPPQDTCVVTLRTALAGRSRRGRIYIPPTTELNQASGIWSAPYVAVVTTFCDFIRGRYVTNAATTKFELGIISRYSNGIKRPTPIFTPMVNYTVRSIVRSQRRRQVGVGA